MSSKQNKKVWFALFPHPDTKKGVVFPVGSKNDWFYFKDYLENEMQYNERPFRVRFEKHLEGWHEQFPEL